MRAWLIISSLLLVASFSVGATHAYAYTSPGTPTGYVNDFAHVLTPEIVQGLNISLAAFEASTSNQIAVVTVPSMNGDYIENYAEKLFKEWGIGSKDKDNGVLLLLSIEEHKLRIEVGYGLEGALPDSVAQRIINNDITPHLKQDDYDTGVLAGVMSIVQATAGEYVGTGSTKNHLSSETLIWLLLLPLLVLQWFVAIFARSKSWWAGGVAGLLAGLGFSAFFGFVIWLTLGLVAGLTLLGLLLDYFVSNAYSVAKSAGVATPWWAGGGSHSSGSSGGFGGGSSGGGGASGGW